MDRTERYKKILTDLVLRYEKLPPSVGQMSMWSVCDDRQGRYSLFYAGWNQGSRTQGTPFFARITDGCVHIEQDGLGHGVTDELVEAGVDRDDISLEYLRRESQEAVVS